MASDERNALAELAERLKGIRKIGNIAGVPYEKMSFSIDDIVRASRIIAELAKVEVYKGCITGTMHIRSGLSERFMNCREIAEEGVSK